MEGFAVSAWHWSDVQVSWLRFRCHRFFCLCETNLKLFFFSKRIGRLSWAECFFGGEQCYTSALLPLPSLVSSVSRLWPAQPVTRRREDTEPRSETVDGCRPCFKLLLLLPKVVIVCNLIRELIFRHQVHQCVSQRAQFAQEFDKFQSRKVVLCVNRMMSSLTSQLWITRLRNLIIFGGERKCCIDWSERQLVVDEKLAICKKWISYRVATFSANCRSFTIRDTCRLKRRWKIIGNR